MKQKHNWWASATIEQKQERIEKVKNKIKQTNLERYGKENYHNTKKCKETKLKRYGDEKYNNPEKMKKTCLERFGVEYPLQNSEIEKQTRETYLKNHGVEYPLQDIKIREKINKNNLETYGAENPFQFPEIKKYIREVNLKKYGTEYPFQCQKIQDHVMQSKLDNHCNPKFSYRGRYKGFRYDSSWELAFIKFCLKNDIGIERNKRGFVYWYKDKKHKYYPDFYLPEVDLFIEVKADWLFNEQTEEKIKQFPYKLDIYRKEKLNLNGIFVK